MGHRLAKVLGVVIAAMSIAMGLATPAMAVLEEVPVYGRWDAEQEAFDGKVHKTDGSVVEGFTVDPSGADFPLNMIGGNIKVDDENVVTFVPKGNGFPNIEGTEDPYVYPDGRTEPWYYYDFTDIPENVQLAGWFYDDGGTWKRIKEGDTLPDHPVTIRANYRITDLKLDGCEDNSLYVPAGGEFKVPDMTTTHSWTLTNQDADKVMYRSISNFYYEAVTHEHRNGSTWGDDRAVGVYGYDVKDRLLDENGKVYNPFEYYDSYAGEWYDAFPFTYEYPGDNNWFANSLGSGWDVTFRADPRIPEGTVIRFHVSMPPYEQRQLEDDPMLPNVGSFTVTIGEKPTEKLPSTITFNPSSLTLAVGGSPVTVQIGGVGDGELTYTWENNGVLEVTDVDGGVSVKPLKAGTCTITVTRAETDTYKATTATYTVTVSESQAPTGGGGGGFVPSNPGTGKPGTDNPETSNPGTDNPGSDEPGKDEPGKDDPSKDEPGEVETVTVWRLCNDATGEHLYTPSRHEHDVLAASGAWRSEGEGWKAPTEGEGVYRLYNPYLDDHLYTTDSNEINVLCEQGWKMDNEGKPLFHSGGSVDLYRLYNPNNGRHLITHDANEYSTLPGYGWTQEGAKLSAVS